MGHGRTPTYGYGTRTEGSGWGGRERRDVSMGAMDRRLHRAALGEARTPMDASIGRGFHVDGHKQDFLGWLSGSRAGMQRREGPRQGGPTMHE